MLLKKITLYHLIPIALAIGLVLIFIQLTSPILSHPTTIQSSLITGKQTMRAGRIINYENGEQPEIELISSLMCNNQLTLFGSSEFDDSPYAPYHFLPDSLGIPALGMGHAAHQELSILCELLATKKYSKGSKICIFLSPNWFTNDQPELDGGTNIEAFLEFVPQHFLSNIVYDKSIDKKYRLHIGRFIDRNYDKINSPSEAMVLLREEYIQPKNNFIRNMEIDLKNKIYGTDHPLATVFDYKIKPGTETLNSSWDKNWESTSKRLQKAFLTESANNKLFVNDVYYKTFLLKKNVPASVEIEPLDLKNCREFKDFKLLVALLKENEMDCSFIIQPLNPYYYKKLDNYNELWSSVEKVLKTNKIPCLNLFVRDQKNYEPGTLKDIMHLGDYGWMKVNHFLNSTYYE